MIYKKYSELDAWIPTLTAGTYELTVDCSGVPASEYRSDGIVRASPFGNKFRFDGLNKNEAKFKLWMTNVIPFTDARNMFSRCSGLISIDTQYFTNVTNAEGMFQYCSGLTSIDTKTFTKVTNANRMLNGCNGLTSIDTTAFTQVTLADSMFYECTGLTSIDTTAFTQVTLADSMFGECTGLTSIDTTAFTQVTEAYYMFSGCSGLTSIDTTAFTQVTGAGYMFYKCTGLTTILFGTNNMPGSGTYENAPIKVARVRGPNAEAVKAAVINAAGTSKWPTSATWTVEQTNEYKFVRLS